MPKAEYDRIFAEHFEDMGPRAFFLQPGEIADENNRWEGRTYLHKASGSAVMYISHNEKMRSIWFIEAKDYSPTKFRGASKGEYLLSITFNSQGVQSKTLEAESKQLERKVIIRATLDEAKQKMEKKIEYYKELSKKGKHNEVAESSLKELYIYRENVEKQLQELEKEIKKLQK